MFCPDCDGVGFGLGRTFFVGIPLDQIDLFPDFKHVNAYPLLVTLVPAFWHALPAFGVAALALTVTRSETESMKKASVALALIASPDLISGQ